MANLPNKILETVDSIASLLKPGTPNKNAVTLRQETLPAEVEKIYQDLLMESELKRIIQHHELNLTISLLKEKTKSFSNIHCENNLITPIQASQNSFPQDDLGDIEFDEILLQALREKFKLQRENRQLNQLLNGIKPVNQIQSPLSDDNIWDTQDKTSKLQVTALKCAKEYEQVICKTITSTKFRRLREHLKHVEETNNVVIQRLGPRFDNLCVDNKIEASTQCDEENEHKLLAALKSELKAAQSELTCLKSDFNQKRKKLQQDNSHLIAVLKDCQEQKSNLEIDLRKEITAKKLLREELFDLKGNIRVFCRIKPLEVALKPGIVINLRSNSIETIENSSVKYKFMKIFGPHASQENIFQEIQQFVSSAVDGYNATIMAYGQTGSGKTFTMNGTKTDPGISFRALEYLFLQKNAHNRESFHVSVSVSEVYNDHIFDLLGSDGAELQLRMSEAGEVVIENRVEKECSSIEAGFSFLQHACDKRQSAAHSLNQASSRSHLIIQFHLKRPATPDRPEFRTVLNLIDLAGSERLHRTNTTGHQLLETQHINQSLSILGSVMNALHDRKRRSHIPYRDSKLTFFLKNYIKPESRGKVSIMINVSADVADLAETKSSLYFGQRCSSIKLGKIRRMCDKSYPS